MIKTLCLNPAVDRTATIERFCVNAVNRVSSSRLDAGGKGINVSKAILALGGRSVAYGFLGGATGRFIRDYLDAQGIAHRFIEIEGETRINLKIVDPELGTHTDINEGGPTVDGQEIALLTELLFKDASPSDLFAFSGSVAPGVAPGLYASLIRRARALGATTLLDADGDALRLGSAAGPSVLKPNLQELERLVGLPLRSGGKITLQAVLKASRGLLANGTSIVVVSFGAEGALFVNADSAIKASGIPVTALSTVGAGDSMAAAICLGVERGDRLEDLVAPAVAAGTAAAATAGSSAFDPEILKSFLSKVHYEVL